MREHKCVVQDGVDQQFDKQYGYHPSAYDREHTESEGTACCNTQTHGQCYCADTEEPHQDLSLHIDRCLFVGAVRMGGKRRIGLRDDARLHILA